LSWKRSRYSASESEARGPTPAPRSSKTAPTSERRYEKVTPKPNAIANDTLDAVRQLMHTAYA